MSEHETPIEADAEAPKARRLYFGRFRIIPDPTLQSRFEELNRLYFDGTLPVDKYLVAWSRVCAAKDARGTFWGWYPPYNKYLILLDYTLRNDAEELTHTLLHEMAHAKLYGNGHVRDAHGSIFKCEMRRLERAGACKIPVLQYGFLDPVTGVSESHACKDW